MIQKESDNCVPLFCYQKGKLSERKIATLLSDCVSCAGVYSETGQSRHLVVRTCPVLVVP